MRAPMLRGSMPLLPLFLLALASCSGTPTEPAESVRVSTELSRTALRTGESVTVTVTATNISKRSITIEGNTCPAPFEVLQGNRVVAPGGGICAAYSLRIPLAPGESHSFAQQWFGDTRQADPARSATIPLASGSYTVRGVVGGSMGEVTGNEVPISITR